MTTVKMSSIKGRVIRVTRLDDCGVPVFGQCSQIVTKGFISVKFARNEQAGDTYLQKNAYGELCVNEKDPDLLKWIDLTVDLCEIDPGLMDIMGNGTPVISGTDTIGEMYGPQAPVGAFALEVWTKKAGQDACAGGTPQWGYFVVPFTKNGKVSGDWNVQNAPLNVTLHGEAHAATSAWGMTPYGDNPMRRVGGFSAGYNLGRVVTTVQPPAETGGCVELPNRGAITPTDVFPPNLAVTAQDATNAGTLTALGYVTSGAAWATGEYFSIGTFKFNWTGTAWAAGVHA